MHRTPWPLVRAPHTSHEYWRIGLPSSGTLEREFYDEPWPGAFAVLGPDAAAGAEHDLPRDGEAEAGVFAETVLLRALGIEAFEDRLEILRRDAGAFVLDNDAREPVVRRRRNPDRLAVGAERHRVVDQIADDLTKTLVTANDRRTFWEIDIEFHRHALGKIGEVVDLDNRFQQVRD